MAETFGNDHPIHIEVGSGKKEPLLLSMAKGNQISIIEFDGKSVLSYILIGLGNRCF